MRRTALLILFAPFLLAPGCPQNKFKLTMEMTPDGNVQRELSIWRTDDGKIDDPHEDMLEQAQKAYGGSGEVVEKNKRRFSGSFAGDLPVDLVHEGTTNHGVVGVSQSHMGRVLTYVERMPGRIDLVELFRTGERFADTFVRAWIAWARQQPELRAEPEKLNALVRFAQTELRDDVLNALLMGWQAIVQGQGIEDSGLKSEDAKDALWEREQFRLLSYLVERGYLRTDEVSELESLRSAVTQGMVRKAARVMGYASPDVLPAPLKELADPDESKAAFEAGLKAIGLTSEEFEEQLAPAIGFSFGSGTDGEVTWRYESEPFSTNGTWDAKTKELSWDADARQGCMPPQVLFAVWSEPDEAFQEAHFGRLVIADEALRDYNGWRRSLTAEQYAEWDAFVLGLRAGPELVKELERFRFRAPASPPSSAPATQPADEPPEGVKFILGGLEADE